MIICKEGIFLADSNITKKALANALKELMISTPFKDIGIGTICEKCEMNRKSFYYHFRDKYDLVNWIYDTEFIRASQNKEYDTAWDFLEDICIYFYENKTFYKKALKIEGQNSFSEYFREMIMPISAEYLRETIPDVENGEFYVKILTEAIISWIEKWILEREDIQPEKFIHDLKFCIGAVSQKMTKKEINEKIGNKKQEVHL